MFAIRLRVDEDDCLVVCPANTRETGVFCVAGSQLRIPEGAVILP